MCWIAFVAPDTVSYLRPVTEDVLRALHVTRASGHVGAASASLVPFGNQIIAAGAVLVLCTLQPFGWWQAWRRYRRQGWALALTIGSLSWFAVIVVRLAVPDGSELAGRASSFVYIPAAFVASLAVTRLISVGLHWQASAVAALALAGALIMMFDGMANGWPPYWERCQVPIKSLASSARWAPGNRRR